MASPLPYNMEEALQIKSEIMKSLIHQIFSKFSETFDGVKCRELSQ